MKTKEELKQIKEEYAELNKKLAELTEEELSIVTGGISPEEHNIMLSVDFTGNYAPGSGGGVINEGKF